MTLAVENNIQSNPPVIVSRSAAFRAAAASVIVWLLYRLSVHVFDTPGAGVNWFSPLYLPWVIFLMWELLPYIIHTCRSNGCMLTTCTVTYTVLFPCFNTSLRLRYFKSCHGKVSRLQTFNKKMSKVSRLLNTFCWKDSQGQKLTFAWTDPAKAVWSTVWWCVLKVQILISLRGKLWHTQSIGSCIHSFTSL